MVTFKQSLILLVSIITVLAVIAIVTGLSPLYWPRPVTSHEHNVSIVLHPKIMNSSDVDTNMVTPLKVVTKKSVELTTSTMNITLSTMINGIVPNATQPQ